MLNCLIIGETGQLGRALAQAQPENYATTFLNRQKLDLSATGKAIKTSLASFKNHDLIIIAAAYTAVDAAQTDYETANQVNHLAPKAIAEFCADNKVSLIYISTDYVFDGSGIDESGDQAPYVEDAKTSPINKYGQSKRDGELAIERSGARAAILRTSWVFDGSGKNFLTTMLRLAQERDRLTIVDDQKGRPTYAGHLADAIWNLSPSLMSGQNAGYFHVTNTGPIISWADFAMAIFDATKDIRPHDVEVVPIPSKDYPTPAARPAYSALDTSRFETQIGTLPPWRDGLIAAINEYKIARPT